MTNTMHFRLESGLTLKIPGPNSKLEFVTDQQTETALIELNKPKKKITWEKVFLSPKSN